EAIDTKVQQQYELGALTDDERRNELVKLWTETTEKVDQIMRTNFPEENSVLRLVESGASGNWMQVRQLAGMRGLVTNPKGEIIPRPIVSNYREGLAVLESFIASHGARKGLADTALRTADSGYLTRRLVDVSGRHHPPRRCRIEQGHHAAGGRTRPRGQARPARVRRDQPLRSPHGQ